VRPDRSAVLSTFLLSYMNSGIGRAYFRSKAKRTTNLATINSSEVRAMPVVLPPLEEQSRLVRGVEAVRRAVLSVRSRQEERKRAVVAVRRALLDRAFEGTGGWEPGR
jgi:type I restriction enzyme S subunit